jgi:hypothetical protein
MSRLVYYINRAGTNLSRTESTRLEQAKELLGDLYEVLSKDGSTEHAPYDGQTILVYDNGGKTMDRYTIFVTYSDGTKAVFGMSDNPDSPQGFNQYVGDGRKEKPGSHLGRKLRKIPKKIQHALDLRASEERREPWESIEEAEATHRKEWHEFTAANKRRGATYLFVYEDGDRVSWRKDFLNLRTAYAVDGDKVRADYFASKSVAEIKAESKAMFYAVGKVVDAGEPSANWKGTIDQGITHGTVEGPGHQLLTVKWEAGPRKGKTEKVNSGNLTLLPLSGKRNSFGESIDEVTKAEHKKLLAKAMRGQGSVRPIDPEEYPPIRGLEGPFQFKDGRVLYYDAKEGKYYDSKRDMYVSNDNLPESIMDEGGQSWSRAMKFREEIRKIGDRLLVDYGHARERGSSTLTLGQVFDDWDLPSEDGIMDSPKYWTPRLSKILTAFRRIDKKGEVTPSDLYKLGEVSGTDKADIKKWYVDAFFGDSDTQSIQAESIEEAQGPSVGKNLDYIVDRQNAVTIFDQRTKKQVTLEGSEGKTLADELESATGQNAVAGILSQYTKILESLDEGRTDDEWDKVLKGNTQKTIVAILMAHGEMSLTQLASHKKLRKVHFMQIQKSAAVLASKGFLKHTTDPREGDVYALDESIEEGYQHVHFKGSKAARSKLAWKGKRKSVQGRTFDGKLIIHPALGDNYQWSVSHIRTGLSLVPYPYFADDVQAVKFAKAAASRGSWDFETPDEMTDELKKGMLSLIKSFRREIRLVGQGYPKDTEDESIEEGTSITAPPDMSGQPAKDMAAMGATIKKGIKLPFVDASIMTLGGPDRPTLFITLGWEPKSSWESNIFENSVYAKISLDSSGVMEMFTRPWKRGMKLPFLRKGKYKNAADALRKINAVVKKVQTALQSQAESIEDGSEITVSESEVDIMRGVLKHFREHGRQNASSLSQAIGSPPEEVEPVLQRMESEDLLLGLGGGFYNLPEKEEVPPTPNYLKVDPASIQENTVDEGSLQVMMMKVYNALRNGRKVKPPKEVAEILDAPVSKPMSLRTLTREQIGILTTHLRGQESTETEKVSFNKSQASDFMRVAKAVGISEDVELHLEGERFICEVPSHLAFTLEEAEEVCEV